MSYRRPSNIDCMISLKIDNLSSRTTSHDLQKMFKKFGKIGDIFVPRTFSGKGRGFAFVRYYDAQEAENAVKTLNGSLLYGRFIRVQLALFERPTFPLRPSIRRERRRSRDLQDEKPLGEHFCSRSLTPSSGGQCHSRWLTPSWGGQCHSTWMSPPQGGYSHSMAKPVWISPPLSKSSTHRRSRTRGGYSYSVSRSRWVSPPRNRSSTRSRSCINRKRSRSSSMPKSKRSKGRSCSNSRREETDE